MMYTEDEVKAVEYALDQLEFCCDQGPKGEGWQSNELVKGASLLRELFETFKNAG